MILRVSIGHGAGGSTPPCQDCPIPGSPLCGLLEGTCLALLHGVQRDTQLVRTTKLLLAHFTRLLAAMSCV